MLGHLPTSSADFFVSKSRHNTGLTAEVVVDGSDDAILNEVEVLLRPFPRRRYEGSVEMVDFLLGVVVTADRVDEP